VTAKSKAAHIVGEMSLDFTDLLNVDAIKLQINKVGLVLNPFH